MSKVADMIKYRLSELAYLERFKEDGGPILDPTMTSLSLRVSKDLLNHIDIIANELELSRSDLVRSFLEMSVSESFKELGMTYDVVLERMSMLNAESSEELQEKYAAQIEKINQKAAQEGNE